jgi:hypothetical protein
MNLKKFLIIFPAIFCTNLSFADEVIVGAGGFNIQRSAIVYGAVEYRGLEKLWKLKPLVGVIGNVKNGAFLYAGVNIDLPITDKFIASVNVAPGFYHKGRGKDLGGAFEIKSQFELWYLLKNEYKIGGAISHMSNAGIYKRNPGLDNVSLQLSVPF